jgi:hypothetical protein
VTQTRKEPGTAIWNIGATAETTAALLAKLKEIEGVEVIFKYDPNKCGNPKVILVRTESHDVLDAVIDMFAGWEAREDMLRGAGVLKSK